MTMDKSPFLTRDTSSNDCHSIVMLVFVRCRSYNLQPVQLSHEKKNLLLSIESWLLNRDPYNGLLKS